MKQIEPKELRIGNYFMEYRELSKFAGDFYHLLDCKPIELTPEWLVNFGFAYKQRSSEYFNHKYYFKEIANNNGNKKFIEVSILESSHSEVTKYEVILFNEYRWGEIREARVFWSNELHVHTLQNLVFVLSGNDLELK